MSGVGFWKHCGSKKERNRKSINVFARRQIERTANLVGAGGAEGCGTRSLIRPRMQGTLVRRRWGDIRQLSFSSAIKRETTQLR
jgi:hypothetical protein